jgi:predicted RNA-binding protein (virulence factor B family)
MIRIGRINSLKIKERRPDVICLDAGESGDIFLPAKDVAAKYKQGDEIEVFVHADKGFIRLRRTLSHEVPLFSA